MYYQPPPNTVAATRRSNASSEEFAAMVDKFYAANPGLQDRKPCVARTYDTLHPTT